MDCQSIKEEFIQRQSVSSSQKNIKIESNISRSTGVWEQEEQKKYIIFLDFFKQHLQSCFHRKHNRIFKMMASFIGTRDPVQCRSHHIKQLKSSQKIPNIIQKAKKSLESWEYLTFFEKMNPILTQMKSNVRFPRKQKEKKVIEKKDASTQTEEGDEFNYVPQEEWIKRYSLHMNFPLFSLLPLNLYDGWASRQILFS